MRRHFHGDDYVARVLAGIILAQVLVLLCIKLWPLPLTPRMPDIVYFNPEAIQMEEVVSTRQTHRAPPPPPPLPPVIRPEDIILEEELVLDFDPLTTGPDLDEIPADAESPPSGGLSASEPPKPVRIVTPEYPRSAQRRKIRAEIVIAVVVDKRGRVQSPQVLERYVLNEKEDTRTLVDELGHGLEEAAISAALRSLFRPARKGGTAVDSEHRLSFKFGV